MKVDVLQLEPCKRLLKIEIPKEAVAEELESVYKEIKKVAQVPGFRKGKAPRQILEKYHFQDAKDEALKRLIPSGYSAALKKLKISPVSLPEIDKIKFEENKPLYFEAAIDIKPEIKIKKYKELSINRKKLILDEKEVEGTLNLLRERLAEYKTIDTRPIKDGDYIVADYECSVDGKVTEKKEKLWLCIKDDKKQPNSDIVNKLKGANISQEVEIKTNLPKDYPKADAAGKEAVFKIVIKEIKEKSLPPLDNEFVKNIGDYKTLDELKEAIRKDIKLKKESEIKANMELQLSELLLKLNPIDAPSSMISGQTEELVKSAKTRLMYQGLKEEEIKLREKELREGFKVEAERQVKMHFILDAIVESENIICEEEDLKLRLEEIAGKHGRSPEEIREHLTKDNSLEALKDQLCHEKTIDFLIKEARIKEV